MRDLIAPLHPLLWLLWATPLLLLSLRTRKPGRHSAAHFTAQPTPVQLSPSIWLKPWNTPPAPHVVERGEPFEDDLPNVARPYVAGFPRPRTEQDWQRERRRAAAFAAAGMDYPYSYPGAPTHAGAAV
ncbi:hypothetical protein ABZY81_16875 [Streptomyces sp. NPDC006514]|uniref:hypothetical protein n=1 Tax=Streptomyces sp. NPDC006514 TaxID=3154308 RepID=UPI0033A0ECB6